MMSSMLYQLNISNYLLICQVLIINEVINALPIFQLLVNLLSVN